MRSALSDKKGRPRVGLLMGGVVGAIVAGLYLDTLAPDVLPYAQVTQDSPALQATVPNLGISHPTGYPVYMMLAHLLTHLPFGEVAYRVNLASAVFGVLAVVLIYLTGLLLTGRALAGAVGAVAFGVSPTFWGQAVIAEVYTLNAVFMAWLVLLLLYWRERREDRYLLLCAFFAGLSLSNHLTSGLLIPAGLVFVWLTDRRTLARSGLWVRGCGLFLLGLLPYLYLPIRSSARLPENTGDLSTIRGVAAMISGGPFKGWMFAFGPLEVLDRIGLYAGYLVQQFPIPLLLAGAFGALLLGLRDRAAAVLTGIVFAGTLVFSLQYAVSDVYVFFIPTYLVLALWISAGVGAFSRIFEGVGRSPEYGFASGLVLAVAVPLLGLGSVLMGAAGTHGDVDRSRDLAGREMIRAVSGEVERGATVVHRRSPLLYMQKVQDERQDLKLWDFREPHTETGLAKATRALERGEVYFLGPDEDTISSFEAGGYDMVRVEGEMLYRAEPPGAREPDTYDSSVGCADPAQSLMERSTPPCLEYAARLE